ncbi:MAG: hypothetical protein OEY49_15670 [Candidatus Heimdallarchaeota archaeon]|nr:hypothetical protein [Candidatus Heimdallarchaeota archaeon]
MSKTAYPELIDKLMSISSAGFTSLQAAAYIALIQLGEETGSAVANASGINRSKIYDVLNQLEEMRAIKKVSREKKIKYIAVDPDIVFSGILELFKDGITKSIDALKNLQDINEFIEPAITTLTTLTVESINTNEYKYLITSNEETRLRLTDKLNKTNKPTENVKILNLNINSRDSRGVILMIGVNELLLFGAPTGQTVEALKIENYEISEFFYGLMENKWQSDLPDTINNEITSGSRKAIFIGKAISMHYNMIGKERYEYNRPVTFLLTTEHLSFFYYDEEFPRLPLISIKSVTQKGEDELFITFHNPRQGNVIGELWIKMVGNTLILKNLLEAMAGYKNQ